MSRTLTSILGTGPGDPINYARNGIAPSGYHIKKLATWLNSVAARRKKAFFSKSLLYADANPGSDYDGTTWRCACHTGPTTTSVRAEWVYIPPAALPSTGDISARWSMHDNLDGTSGSTTDHPLITVSTNDPDIGVALVPDDYRVASQTFAVAPDADYVWSLVVDGSFRVLSASLYEEPQSYLADTLTNAIDTAGLGWGQAILAADVAAIRDLADKLHKRGGKHLFSWCEKAGVARTTATARNMFDQTLSAWAATNPGFGTRPRYMGSLDSDDVACTWCIYAKVAAGAGGTVDLVAQSDTLDTLTVTSTTGAWYSGTFNLASSETDEKLEIYLTGDGTNALTIYSAAAWVHGA